MPSFAETSTRLARLKRRAGVITLVLTVFVGLAVTRDVRVAESQVSGTTAALSFRDAAASFWSPSGAATGSWQTLIDGNLPVGNQAAYVNTTAGDSDHLSRQPRITLGSPANFSYEVQARTQGSAWMGLSFHHAAGGDRYVFRVQSGTSNWQLLETTGGSTSTLASGTLELPGEPGGGCGGGGGGSVTVPTGEYITLGVERSSSSPSTIDVYYEGELQASVNDPSPRSGGQVGVYSRGQPVYFHAPAVVGDLDATVRLVVDTTSVEGSIEDEFWGSSISLFGKLNGISDTITDENVFDQSIAKWLDYVDQMTASDSMFPTQIRYPSGYEGHGNFWNQAIGPVAGRRPDGLDQLFGNNPTKAVIGTDEAAALAFEMGGNLNLLANADTAVSVLDGAQNADPVLAAALAADWVEYTNSPANGSNPNGGTDWAAVRAANGHFEPFDVEVWEIGNEVPFVKNGSAFLAGRENYRQRVIRFSDAMLGVDPGLTLGAQDDLFYFPGVPAEWFDVMNDPSVSGKFDFWISHIYGPSLTEAGIVSGDVALSAPRDFPSTGTYTFTLRAALEEAGSPFPTLILTVDGANVFSTAIDEPLTGPGGGGEFLYQFPTYQAQVNITAGTHQIGIRIPDASPSKRVLIESVIEVNGQRANPVNLAKDPRFYQMIMGTADAVRTFFGTQRDTYYNGKPGYVTEWNTIWGQRGRPVDLTGMIANAGVVAEFLRFGTPLANFFSLYGEGPTFFGAFDGVDFDPVNQVGIGQDATPRPSAFLLEAGRQLMKGDLVETDVSPFGFFANADDGLVPANRPGALREIPNWVRATSALSPSGNRLTVMVINRHPTLDLPIDLDLGSYVPTAGAEVLLTGPDISANNEPENESGGALEVEPQLSPLASVGSQFTYTAPRHSVAFLVLDRTDQSPPSAPGGFDASVDGADVDLSWSPSGSGDVVGYHVYRSVTATGPYRGRITSSPVAGTAFTDTTAERGETYRYAVRAIDADGHESELSNVDQVTLPGSPSQTTLASAVSVTSGSAVGGSAAELDEADAVYYDVQVSGGAAEYEATFDLPHTSSTATALAVFVNAHHVAPGTAPRILRLQLRDHNASSWVEVITSGSTPKGQIDTRLVYGTVSGADLGRFISAGGQVRARVRMQSVGSDILRSDFIGVRSRG